MDGSITLSTAYLPPVEYIALASSYESILIEREENYIKQSYRNRCYILTSSGVLALTVPVFLGSFHKTPVKDIRIDYTRRWQPVHIGAIRSAYSAAPFFLHYFEAFEKPILRGHKYLLDLNMELLESVAGIMKFKQKISYTTEFQAVKDLTTDSRYSVSPKKPSSYSPGKYIRVFDPGKAELNKISIIDLLFNEGPDSEKYL